ncbi:hypothetical protein CRG98_049500, partial [Punica granatum]
SRSRAFSAGAAIQLGRGEGIMRSPIVLVGLLLLFCCCADVLAAEYMKYKDPKQPVNVRIKDLMSRMTLEEKIGQMTQIE